MAYYTFNGFFKQINNQMGLKDGITDTSTFLITSPLGYFQCGKFYV